MAIPTDEFDDNALPGRLYPLLKEIVTTVNTIETDVNSATNGLINSQTDVANAQATAQQAQITAENAQILAQYANDRLAGDGDFYIGLFPMYTHDNEFIVDVMAQTTAQGISYDNVAKKFSFSYLGWYLIQVLSHGDFSNLRTDWYQEIRLMVKQNGVVIAEKVTRLPPNGTYNITDELNILVKVSLGEVVTIAYSNTAMGVMNAGCYSDVRVKKVV